MATKNKKDESKKHESRKGDMREDKKEPKALLSWRSKQKKGAIMKPSTFKAIVKTEEKKGLSKERATKVAGKAYWGAAEAKFKKAKKK